MGGGKKKKRGGGGQGQKGQKASKSQTAAESDPVHDLGDEVEEGGEEGGREEDTGDQDVLPQATSLETAEEEEQKQGGRGPMSVPRVNTHNVSTVVPRKQYKIWCL